MRRALLLAVLLFPAACGPGSNSQSTRAAIGLAAGVAAAGVYRATTGGCWADCRPGTYCDRDAGLCKPVPCSKGDCYASASAPESASTPTAPPPLPDPCRGLCFPGERCVVESNIADCVPL